MKYKYSIKSYPFLIGSIVISIYFGILFLNNTYAFITRESRYSIFVELTTIPLILVAFLLLFFSIKNIIIKNGGLGQNYMSVILLLATIISMFVMK